MSSNALVPLVYWYGHAETKRNPLLLDRLIRNLGDNVREKYDSDPEGQSDSFAQESLTGYIPSGDVGRASGIIVDTPSSFGSGPSSGSSSDHRHNLIKSCVDAFESMFVGSQGPHGFLSEFSSIVNVILVVGHEKLNVEMQRTYGSRLSVVKIPKSGGVRTTT